MKNEKSANEQLHSELELLIQIMERVIQGR